MLNHHKRNCGEIQGSLQELQPFIFLARPGVSLREQKARVSAKMGGIFVVSAVAGTGVCPQLGVILPLNRCRHAGMREALQQLQSYLVQNAKTDDNRDRFNAAQAMLSEKLDGKLKIQENAKLDGYVELERTRELFLLLAQHFDYVTEIADDPVGIALPTAYQHFKLKSYGEFLEWFYRKISPDHWGWRHCYPRLVFDQTGLLGNFWTSHTEIIKPSVDLGNYFTIQTHISNQHVFVRLEMRKYGWSCLHVTIGDRKVSIKLSQVFPPFETMLEWIKRVSGGDLPAQFDIDEEGTEKRLVALCTDDPGRVFFRIITPYDSEDVCAEGIVSRAELTNSFKSELLRFFETEFDPEHWGEDEDGDQIVIPIRQRILSDRWLSR